MADRRRVELLYRRYGPSIYARCRQLLREDTLAEDATQESFIKAYKNLERCSDDDEAKLWLFRIASNHCFDILRARSRQLPPIDQLFANANGGPSVEDQLANRLLAKELVAQASERVRPAAQLHYVDCLPTDEVAQILGVTRRTVENHLAAFLREVRKVSRPP